MIKTTTQYNVTAEQLAKLESGLVGMATEPPANAHPILWEASKAGFRSQIDKLRKEIEEWDKAKQMARDAYKLLSGSFVDGHIGGLKVMEQAKQLNPYAVHEVGVELEAEFMTAVEAGEIEP